MQKLALLVRAGSRGLGSWARRSPRAAVGAALLGAASLWTWAAVSEPEVAELAYEQDLGPAPGLTRQRHDVYLGFANLPAPPLRRRSESNEPLRQLRPLWPPKGPEAAAVNPAVPAAVDSAAWAPTGPQPEAPVVAQRDFRPDWIPPVEIGGGSLIAAALSRPQAGAPAPAEPSDAEPPNASDAAAEPAAPGQQAAPVTPSTTPVAPGQPAVPVKGVKPGLAPIRPAPAQAAPSQPDTPVVAVPNAPSPVLPLGPGHPEKPALPAVQPAPAGPPAVKPAPAAPAAPAPDIVIGRNDEIARPTLPPPVIGAIGGEPILPPALDQAPPGFGVAAELDAPVAAFAPFRMFAVGDDGVALVPEPGSLFLLGGGLLALAGLSARRR